MISAHWDDRGYGEQVIEPLSVLKISFDRVWPWLKKAVASYGPTHRKWHVWQRIESEQSQLWTCETAAIVTSIQVWPTGFKEMQGWLSGGDFDGVLSLKPIIERWAAGLGCDRIAMTGRNGWRKLGFDKYSHLASTLTRDLKP